MSTIIPLVQSGSVCSVGRPLFHVISSAFDMLISRGRRRCRVNKRFDFSMAHMIKINSTHVGMRSCRRAGKWLICIMYTHIPFPHTHLLPPHTGPPGWRRKHDLATLSKQVHNDWQGRAAITRRAIMGAGAHTQAETNKCRCIHKHAGTNIWMPTWCRSER